MKILALTILGSVIASLIVLGLCWVAAKGWVKFKGPIMLKERDLEKWSTNEKKRISDAGYDLTKLDWIPDYDIPNTPHKPVLIGWRILKREVHTKIKVGYLQLFEKTESFR
jgi:hypothetical protein